MEDLTLERITLSYNGRAYLILPDNGTGGALLPGKSQCINYLLNYNCPLKVKFDEVLENGKFSEDDKKMFKKVISNHNKLKSIEFIFNKWI